MKGLFTIQFRILLWVLFSMFWSSLRSQSNDSLDARYSKFFFDSFEYFVAESTKDSISRDDSRLYSAHMYAQDSSIFDYCVDFSFSHSNNFPVVPKAIVRYKSQYILLVGDVKHLTNVASAEIVFDSDSIDLKNEIKEKLPPPNPGTIYCSTSGMIICYGPRKIYSRYYHNRAQMPYFFRVEDYQPTDILIELEE